jgi:tRNA (Thr-GGU) A37 N-methylase
MQPISIKPIGRVRNDVRGDKENYWGHVQSSIELDGQELTPDCLLGLKEFSHVEVIFYFHQVKDSAIVTSSRHPRDNREWPLTGILAQRGKVRPNRIGATICRLLEVSELQLTVLGLDAFDGTPVIDIKPVFAEFLPAKDDVRQPGWSRELMARYFLARETPE